MGPGEEPEPESVQDQDPDRDEDEDEDEEEVAAVGGVHDADDVEEETVEQRDDEENNNNAADGESGSIVTENTTNNTDLVKLVTKDPSCAAHSMCALLVGDCCPSKEGIILDCCYGIPPDQEDVVKVVEGNDN